MQPLDVAYPDFAALGHAVDYRLRLSLGRGLGDAVSHGVMALHPAGPSFPGIPGPGGRDALHAAGLQLLPQVERHLAWGGQWLEEDTLSRLCFVAAYFEDVFRCGQLRRYSLLARADAFTTLEQLLGQVPAYAPADLEAQMALAEQPFAALRALPEQERVCGPVFTGSADIGGADADFILGGLLLDCKATTRPRMLEIPEIYQLAGYLLLDYDDQYRIDRVGLYLSRQGHMITWAVPEFLQRAGATEPLPVLRHQLRRFLLAEDAVAHPF